MMSDIHEIDSFRVRFKRSRKDLSRWGVPVAADTALIVANENGAQNQRAKDCWKKHEAGEFIDHDPAY